MSGRPADGRRLPSDSQLQVSARSGMCQPAASMRRQEARRLGPYTGHPRPAQVPAQYVATGPGRFRTPESSTSAPGAAAVTDGVRWPRSCCAAPVPDKSVQTLPVGASMRLIGNGHLVSSARPFSASRCQKARSPVLCSAPRAAQPQKTHF